MRQEQRSAPADVRLVVLQRDDYTCQDCGLRGEPGYCLGNVQVHHIRGWRWGGDHSLDNLVTLCVACHKARDAQKLGEGQRAAYRRHVEAGIVSPSARWLRDNPDVVPGRPRATPRQERPPSAP